MSQLMKISSLLAHPKPSFCLYSSSSSSLNYTTQSCTPKTCQLEPECESVKLPYLVLCPIYTSQKLCNFRKLLKSPVHLCSPLNSENELRWQ